MEGKRGRLARFGSLKSPPVEGSAPGAENTRGPMPFKFPCHCGTKHAFEAAPINGRMPWAVTCPSCGADATGVANQILQQAASAQTAQVASAAAPPPTAAPAPAPIRIGVATKTSAPPASGSGAATPDDESGGPRSSTGGCRASKAGPPASTCQRGSGSSSAFRRPRAVHQRETLRQARPTPRPRSHLWILPRFAILALEQ